MIKKKEWTKFKLHIPNKKRFEFYREMCKALGEKSVSSRIWNLIENDIELMITAAEYIKQEIEVKGND